MKKTKILSLAFLCCLSLIGCSNNDENDSTNQTQITTTNVSETENISEEVSTEKSDTTVATYNEELLELETYEVINDSVDEARTHFLYNFIAVSDNGYYIPNTRKQIKFMDKSSEMVVLLCNRPDCTHEGEECNAYFTGISQGEMSYDLNYVQFYDGYLYTLGRYFDGSVYLCKISEDGSVRERYMRLYKQEPTSLDGGGISFRSPELCIHRGYVYYIMPLEDTPTLRRIKLGTEEVETLFQLPEGGAMMYRIRPYGDFVFFQAGDFTEEGISGMTSGIYAYNVKSEELKLVKEGAIATYTLSDSTMYYTNSEGISAYDLVGGEDTLVIKNSNNPIFSTDGKYIYIESNDLSVEIYDLSGKFVNRILVQKSLGYAIAMSYFGDGMYLFADGVVDADTSNPIGTCFYIKVDDIENSDGYLYWQPME